MKIRNQQIAAIAKDRIGPFVDECVLFLKEEVPEVVENARPHEIRSFVHHGIDRASRYGIWDSYLIQQYLLFMAWVGEDFDTKRSSRWAAEILTDPTLDQMEKIIALEDYIMSEWEGSR